MVGVLIVVGIIGYGVLYSGLSQLPGHKMPTVGTLEALWPGHGTPTGFPKPTGPNTGGLGQPRTGRTI